MVAPQAPVVFFLSGFKVGFVATWKTSSESFETASRETQTLNLSRNVSKFYA